MAQERNYVKLFDDLHSLLKDFISDYRTDHPALLPIETECLKKLSTIASELRGFLQDKSSTEKFTLSKYEAFILRIESVKPPQEITETHKSEGFFGIGASQTQKKVTIGLHNAMSRLLISLEKKAANEEALEKKGNETTKEAPEKSQKGQISSEMELFKKEVLVEVNQQLKASLKDAYEQGRNEGKKEGQQELIMYFKQHIGNYLDFPAQQKVLLLLESKNPTPSSNTPLPAVFSVPNITETPVIKSEDDEVKKAREWIGDAKFEVVKGLMTLHNSKDTSEQEKSIIKWTIFELMLHKYDQPISSILDRIKTALSNRCNLEINQFPSLYKLFEANSQNQDGATNQKLTVKELTAFHQLTGNLATYLPEDTTASNCFGSKATILKKGTIPTKNTTEEDYINRAISKLNQLSANSTPTNKNN